MKKILAIVLTLLMVAAFAACAKDDTTNLTDGNATQAATDEAVSDEAVSDEAVSDEATSDEATSDEAVSDEAASADNAAVAALSAVWADVIADEALIAAFGAGSSEEVAGYFAGGDSFAPGTPAAYSTEDKEALSFTFGVPAEQAEAVKELATVMHMMNGNNLTAAAYTLTEGTDAAAFAAALKDGITSMQFMCGVPEMLIVAEADGVVISAFGTVDVINAFSAALSENGTIVYEGAVA